MTFEPCTRQNGPNDTIAGPCPICGHTNLVHPCAENSALSECAICTVLAAAIRIEEQRSPVMHMTVTQDEMDEVKRTIKPAQSEQVHRSGHKRSPEDVKALMALVRRDLGPFMSTTPEQPRRCPRLSPDGKIGEQERCVLPDQRKEHQSDCHLGESGNFWDIDNEDKVWWGQP